MRAWLLAAAIGFAGCGNGAPLDVAVARATDDTVAPVCRFDLDAPEPLHGELYADDVPHLDCVPPGGGGAFVVGFAHDRWRFVVTLPRALARPGDTVALDGGPVALLYQGDDGWCADWRGTVAWAADLPAWRVRIDAACADGPARVAGELSGVASTPR